ncbi:MAG: hypothetical protein M5U28_46630 [Sandaracinaceae bacterium]|nr:hypothetical protein [Sandaracinaceae bacterium]
MIELHGNLLKTRCTECARAPFEDHRLYEDRVPFCGECDARGETAMLRPHIVWFGEMLDPTHLHEIERFMGSARERLVFVAVGTSGVVYPAAGLVDAARAGWGRDLARQRRRRGQRLELRALRARQERRRAAGPLRGRLGAHPRPSALSRRRRGSTGRTTEAQEGEKPRGH